MMTPPTVKQYTIVGKDGFESLKYEASAPIDKIGDREVLVKIEGVSLNYRDLIIPKGQYPFPINIPVVPCSDGAGTVVEVGPKVTRFKPGDRVITLFNQGHIAGWLDVESIQTGLGGALNGTLREYGAFDESGLVRCPPKLSSIEAATLSCAGLTAWNALYGLDGNALKAGDTVIVQGTGSVSLFALQFAKAAGATVIATTSSEGKVDTLKKLGADHILNYKTNAQWGEEAKKLTNGRGVNHILEVGGPTSMRQSLNAIAMGGVITIIGFLGGLKGEDQPSFLDCLNHVCTVRGILVGSRQQMEEMCKAVEANPESLKPIIDQKVFALSQAKEAYQYMWDKKHFGKVCIKIE